MARISVKVDTSQLAGDVGAVINKQLNAVIQDKRILRQIANKWAELINPYVPMKTGQLRGNAFITPAGNIRYTAINRYGDDYTSFQYEGYNQHGTDADWKRHTPNTHSHWDQYAMNNTGAFDELCEYTEKLLVEAMNNE